MVEPICEKYARGGGKCIYQIFDEGMEPKCNFEGYCTYKWTKKY